MGKMRGVAWLLASGAMMLAPAIAQAQEAVTDGPNEVASQDAPLGDIVVTAQRVGQKHHT